MLVPSTTSPLSARPIHALFDPVSVAVVGASEDTRKWGNWLAQGALRGESHRPAYLVNHRAGETVLGRRAYRSLDELPEAPDLVVIAVPAAAVDSIVTSALAAGARAIVIISAGPGATGRRRPRRARPRRGSGAARAQLPRRPGRRPAARARPQPPARRRDRAHLPERQPRAGTGAARRAGGAGVLPVRVAGQPGRSRRHRPRRPSSPPTTPPSSSPSTSRTSVTAAPSPAPRPPPCAPASPWWRWPSTAPAPGPARSSRTPARWRPTPPPSTPRSRPRASQRVRTPRELIDAAQALLRCPAARGRRVAVLGDGGGHGSIAAAVAAQAGLEVPELSEAVAEPLRAALPAAAGVSNPIDLAGGAEQDVHAFDRIALAAAVLRRGRRPLHHRVLRRLRRVQPRDRGRGAAYRRADRRRGAAHRTADRHAHDVPPRAPRPRPCARAGVPVYESVEQAAGALALLAARGAWRPGVIPELPAPDAPVGRGTATWRREPCSPAPGSASSPTTRSRAPRRPSPPRCRSATPSCSRRSASRPTSQTRAGWCSNIAERGRAARRLRPRPGRARARALHGRADGPAQRWHRAAHRRALGPALRAGGAGRQRRPVRGDPARHRRAAGPGHRRRGRGDAALAARSPRCSPAPAAGRRSTSPPRPARWRRCRAVAAAHPELAELEINPLLVTRTEAIALDARFIRAPVDAEPQERESAVHLHP